MKKTRAGRVLGLLFLSLFMLACLGYCDVPPVEERMAHSNELDEVIGEVELIVPAERNHQGVYLSPDGRKLLVKTRDAAIVMDFVSGEEGKVKPDCEVFDLRWLDDDHFVIRGEPYCYHVADAQSLSAVRLKKIPEEKYGSLGEVETKILKEAALVYDAYDLGASGHTVVALAEGWEAVSTETDYVIYCGSSEGHRMLDQLLQEIPHVAVPRKYLHGGVKLPSPNGEFYTQTFTSAGRAGYLGIFSKDGELLSRVYKKGWSPWVLGWAYDSSGVYFEMQVGGVDAAVIYPWFPIFKLLVPGAAKRGTPVPMYTPIPTSEGGLPGATVFPLETLVP